jgi:hypothetical protein
MTINNMYYIILEFNVVSFYHSIIFSPQIHMVLHGTTFFANEGIFPLFKQLSADYRLKNGWNLGYALINKVQSKILDKLEYIVSVNTWRSFKIMFR